MKDDRQPLMVNKNPTSIKDECRWVTIYSGKGQLINEFNKIQVIKINQNLSNQN